MRSVLVVALASVGMCGGPEAWDRKGAHSHCKAAIAERPWAPELTCGAIHLCANEAVLTDQERERLEEHRRKLPDCVQP